MVLPARIEALRHGSTPHLLVISASTRRFLCRRVGVYTCKLECMQIADISAVMGVSVQMKSMPPFKGANVLQLCTSVQVRKGHLTNSDDLSGLGQNLGW